MAVLLADSFDTGAVGSGWVSSGTGFHIIPLWGRGGSSCVACGLEPLGTIFYHHATYLGTQGAVRLRLALRIDPLDDTLSPTAPFASLINVGEFNFNPTSNAQFLVYARRDGSITLDAKNTGVADVYTTSAPGLVPVDGTWCALQLRWVFTATTVTLTVTVNNVDVATLVATGGTPWAHVGWQDVRVDTRYVTGDVIHNWPRTMTVIDDVEIDDVSAATAWPLITGPTIDVQRICSGLAPLPPIPPEPPDPPTQTRIRRLRRAPHLSAEQAEQFFAKFQLDFEAGVGTGVDYGRDPQLALRWSDDGGQTWRGPLSVSAGLQGAFRRRAIWRRLGRGRDRVFEVSMDDPVKWALVAANLDAVKGTS